MILKAPSPDIMNKLARSILALYPYDKDPENNIGGEYPEAMHGTDRQ